MNDTIEFRVARCNGKDDDDVLLCVSVISESVAFGAMFGVVLSPHVMQDGFH